MVSTSHAAVDDPQWPFVATYNDGKEVLDPIECTIEGAIPSWLSGQLYRTGPGILAVEAEGRKISLNHWFDGIGLTHLFTIHPKGAGVSYRSRLTGRSRMESIQKIGVAGTTFGPFTDPCQVAFGKMFTHIGHPDQEEGINVTMTPRLVVPGFEKPVCVIKTDANRIQLIDAETLAPVAEKGSVKTYGLLNAELGKGILSASHEEIDPISNSFMNVVVCPGLKSEYIVFEASQDLSVLTHEESTATILAKFKDPYFAYQHSFSSTQKYVIIQLWPLAYGAKGMRIFKARNMVGAMEWDPSRKSRILVIGRQEKRVVAEYQYPADFCFHTVNAFDDPETGDIVMDLLMCKTGEVVSAFNVESLKNSSDYDLVDQIRELVTTRFKRFKLPNLAAEKTKYAVQLDALSKTAPMMEVVFDSPVSMELPRINPSWRHNANYRFVYGVSTMFRHLHSHVLFDSLVKFDTQTQTYVSWMKVGHTPSEPIFVANPTASGNGSEDDGVVLSVVLDGSLAKSYLLVLDAKSFTEVAKADIGLGLPYGLHGAFV
ncbi:carotenoid oxygenase [Obelidium mucronatum]|nr:carotenoid oxygenase [Obelidium mucronatum]